MADTKSTVRNVQSKTEASRTARKQVCAYNLVDSCCNQQQRYFQKEKLFGMVTHKGTVTEL